MIFGNEILGEICEIIDCEHKTAPTQETGIPLIRTPNIGRGNLKLENVKCISQETYLKWTKRATPRPNDLIMAREAPVGNVAIISSGEQVCLGQRTVLIRIKSKSIEPKYLNYMLSSDGMHNYLNVLSNGATVGHLNVTDIRNLKLPKFPKKETQKKIAAILSAYDDLIENNKRRIALLEKMAEEIYREWFVRFRFPGYQIAEFEKGIPKGWDTKLIGHLCLKVTDGAHASPAFFEGGKYMASVKDMENNGFNKASMKTISEQDFEGLAKGDCQPQRNDILIAKDGSYLKHAFVWRDSYDVVLLSSIAILRPNLKKILPLFFSILLKQPSTKSMMSGYVSGSALPRIILKDFKKMQILIPQYSIIEKFEAIIEPMFKQIKTLEESNNNLIKAQRGLLPRLISGKLSVEDLDIQFPPSMQEAAED